MFQHDLAEFVRANPRLVSMKSAGAGIFVLKYSRRVFYDGLWNEFLENCRGTIVDAEFNVVSRPFTKIYNYGIESQAPQISADQEVVAYRKVNGFMVAMTWYNNDILVSTTGSTDSEFVQLAKEIMLTENTWSQWQQFVQSQHGYTLLFECVHPSNRHVVVELPGMYLLAKRQNSWNSVFDGFNSQLELCELAKQINCSVPYSYKTTMSVIQKMCETAKHEGYVVYLKDGTATKIKTPYYLTLKWLARNPRTDKIVNTQHDIKLQIDEEYHPLVDAIRQNIAAYTALDEQQRLQWVRDFLIHKVLAA